MAPTITRAEPSDAAWVAELTALAFEGLAPSVWLVPDRECRRSVLTAAIRVFVDFALVHGEVLRTGRRDGCAVWMPRGGDVPPFPAGEQIHALRAACGRFSDRFRFLGGLLGEHQPTAPHQHLTFMAVEPGRRGEGVGSALLRAAHERLDAERIPAYVASANPAARDLYARHGYRSADPILLPDGAPFWPMWREPAGRSDRGR